MIRRLPPAVLPVAPSPGEQFVEPVDLVVVEAVQDVGQISVNGGGCPHCLAEAVLRSPFHRLMGSAFRNVCQEFVSHFSGRRDLCDGASAVAG